MTSHPVRLNSQMLPIAVPDDARIGRAECRTVDVGPPAGVGPEHVDTVTMLISDVEDDKIPGYEARRQYAYFKPTEEQIGQLLAGGFIEFCQYGMVVQPFSASVWNGDQAVTRAAGGSTTTEDGGQ